ncbi:aspartic peptidase domain-containing protein [Suillus plorans]|uniref:Aspartic peptidase domain-containing protein n=1 Tax=Suillus plorans TaxID=116603 RepID=A0A9P7AK50_9AGAM|nr:aspartic peptidase domain-containing protein [Suillus plorans]KAG1789998.1 aspartic peptidase domain-containing protein [Suillus plorans]
MFSVASLLTIILLALSTTGSPVEVSNSPITLPIARRLSALNGTINLLEQDRARAAALRLKGQNLKNGGHGVPIANVATGYYIAVGIGSPPTTYDLIVDTGTSDTWIGAKKAYSQTSTSIDTEEPMQVIYGSGSAYFDGFEYIDTFTFGNGLTIPQQSFGVALETSGTFGGADGILGLGPVDLTAGTLIDEPTTTIPTVTDNLHSQGTIHREVVSISFEPITEVMEVINGELTFGGTVRNKHGPITYNPITTTSPASMYWGIDQSISYGDTTILSSTAGIVDVDTTYILIASDAYVEYQFLTGSTTDAATGLLLISSAQYAALENLSFGIGGVRHFCRLSHPLLTICTGNVHSHPCQIWPRILNTYIGGSSNAIYLVITDIGTPSGQGFDFVNGYPFAERFYCVFDTSRSRIGFAQTPYTDATTN